jgi:hypothetical protein
MAREVIERPKSPVGKSGKSLGGTLPQLTGVYRVASGTDLVAIYNPAYFLSAKEVVGDFVGVIRSQEEWNLDDDDYAIWTCHLQDRYRIVAILQYRANEDHQRVQFFEEGRSGGMEPWPNWPTREEWIASGRSDLWLKT